MSARLIGLLSEIVQIAEEVTHQVNIGLSRIAIGQLERQAEVGCRRGQMLVQPLLRGLKLNLKSGFGLRILFAR